LPDQHCWCGVKNHFCWLKWCWGSCSRGSGAETQPSLHPWARNPSGCEGPGHPLAAPHNRASSAWPDLSDSTDKSAAMREGVMSWQSFGAWQGFTTCIEQAGVPQGGNVPKGELLSGDTMALWDRVGSWPWDSAGSVCSHVAHGGEAAWAFPGLLQLEQECYSVGMAELSLET